MIDAETRRCALIAKLCVSYDKVNLTRCYLESGLSAEAVQRELAADKRHDAGVAAMVAAMRGDFGLDLDEPAPCRAVADPARLWDEVLRSNGLLRAR